MYCTRGTDALGRCHNSSLQKSYPVSGSVVAVFGGSLQLTCALTPPLCAVYARPCTACAATVRNWKRRPLYIYASFYNAFASRSRSLHLRLHRGLRNFCNFISIKFLDNLYFLQKNCIAPTCRIFANSQ